MNLLDRTEAHQGEGGFGNLLATIPNILRARKWWIIIPAILGVIGSIVAAVVTPVEYTARAIMLVEAPQLPDEVLAQGDVDVIDRRIARIRQRITSRPDLIAMIERHNIYADRRGDDSMTEIINEMRESIVIAPTVASGSNRRLSETIAFTLSYSYSEPQAVQAVTQDLMERILQLDSRGSVEQANNTVEFLEQRASSLEEQIASIEEQISDIKARNGRSLAGGGLIMSGGGGGYDMQIAGLQRDNQNLLAQRRMAESAGGGNPAVAAAERNLAAVRSVYSETHPDVVLARQRLAEARDAEQSTELRDTVVDNINRQIEFNNSQIAALQSAKAREEARIQSQISAQSMAPVLEQQIANLERRLSGYASQYSDVSKQLTAARTGVQAEDEQMTERLSVVEAPITPEEPSSPDYLLIFGVGIVGGIGLGFVLGFAIELLFRPIRDPRTVEDILGVAPLGVIPVIDLFDKEPDVPAQSSKFKFWSRSPKAA